MRLMLLGFAGSVLGTRVYLALTGYPQIGGETLHVAHALWGGLLLLVAALLPLLVANRIAHSSAALLTGVGTGLFIDEVGKFITVDNDYFFPAAAPIAYGTFLIAVWVYLRVRRRREPDTRAELYAVLELLTDALDHRLTPRAHGELEQRLRSAAEQADPSDLVPLAAILLQATRAGHLPVTPHRPGRLRRFTRRLDTLADRLLTGDRLRYGLVVALGVLGILALSDFAVITTIAVDLADRSTSHVVDVANRFARVEIEDRRGVVLLLVRAGLDVLVGAVLVLAAVLLLTTGRIRQALSLAQTGLLASLTVVNLLVFYLEQFLAAAAALVQLAVLTAVQRYETDHTDD